MLNAQVVTLDPTCPIGSYVAVVGDTIKSVGNSCDFAGLVGPDTKIVDCHGMTMVPGFQDSHCHFLALASSLLAIDLGPTRIANIQQVKNIIWEETLKREPGHWIKAFGYDHELLREQRHPTRWDLDEVAPLHPVRLEHRTGHAMVLNSMAMSMLGFTSDSIEVKSGIIGRDEDTREPSGVFLEMSSHIRSLMIPYRDDDELISGVLRANHLLVSKGITSIHDAGPENGRQTWDVFQRLKDEQIIDPRIVMMTNRRDAFHILGRGARGNCWDNRLTAGPVKIMLTLTTGVLQPSKTELEEQALYLHGHGFQLAFHAVEREAVEAAAWVISRTKELDPRADPRHRIEHCSECPPDVLAKIHQSGALVVTHPSFIYHSGERYLSLVGPDMRPHLYPVGSLQRNGVVWAAGSDSPVTSPDPLIDIYSAVTRKTRESSSFYPDQSVTPLEALKAWTTGGAYTAFQENVSGSIEPGKLADLVLLSRNPLEISPECIRDIEVVMTVIGGRIVWEAST